MIDEATQRETWRPPMPDNVRRDGRVSALDLAYNERGLLRPTRAMRELRCTRDLLTHLVNQGKLREVVFARGGRTYAGYPADRIAEIAEWLASGVPMARL